MSIVKKGTFSISPDASGNLTFGATSITITDTSFGALRSLTINGTGKVVFNVNTNAETYSGVITSVVVNDGFNSKTFTLNVPYTEGVDAKLYGWMQDESNAFDISSTLSSIMLGNDILNGGDGNDTLVWTEGNDTLDGGNGADILDLSNFGDGEDLYSLNERGNATYTVTGTAANFTVTNRVTGEVLIARNIETVKIGDEVVSVGRFLAPNFISILSSVTYVLNTVNESGVENLTLTGSAPINATGNDLNNTLTGNSAANILNGLVGADTMIGGLGNDTYVVDNIGDIVRELVGDQGTDTILSSVTYALNTQNAAGVENLTLTGTTAINATGNDLNNTLTGNSGANILNGGLGADTMSGGLGNDTLTGGTGSNTFVFNTVLNATSNRDTITDFISGTDKIELENSIMTGLGLTTGQLTAAQFRSGAGFSTAGDSSDRVIYNTTTGGLFYDADGLGGTAAIQIALLGVNTLLTHQDIFIV